MPIDDFFPPRPVVAPTIYAFASTHPDHAGLLKVAYTERMAADRIGWKRGTNLRSFRC
jgi:hypothetical protein